MQNLGRTAPRESKVHVRISINVIASAAKQSIRLDK